MVVVTSATFGDEFTSTDVLKTIQDKITANGSVSIPVDSSILPVQARILGADQSLNTAEKEEKKEQKEPEKTTNPIMEYDGGNKKTQSKKRKKEEMEKNEKKKKVSIKRIRKKIMLTE